nr:MAG TPA: hypothetical protein [Caudoviricetes sp.]
MLQKEFEQLTGIKVSEEDFEKINEMYIEAGNMDKKSFCEAYKKGDFLSVVPTVIETVKRTANYEGYQEGQDEIHDLKMQIAAKDEVIREKDELLQAQLEDIKKAIKEYMNLGQYDKVLAFKPLFLIKGDETGWVAILCNIARSND